MLRIDEIRLPGGRLAPFMAWARRRWEEWRELSGVGPLDPVTENDHARFDAWLELWVAEQLGEVIS